MLKRRTIRIPRGALAGLVLSCALLLFLSPSAISQERRQLDSASRKSLDASLAEYFSALESESIPAKIGECDFILDSAQQGVVRDYVASRIYAHYVQSGYMGDESVAVHVVENWLDTGKASFPDPQEEFMAKLFARTNSPTLIGKRAPSLILRDTSGEEVDVLGSKGSGYAGSSDRYRVLLFYRTDCTTCRAEARILADNLPSWEYPLDLIAVNLGDDAAQWMEFRRGYLSFDIPANISVRHLWDPYGESDMKERYGILQTPAMFLLDKDGTVMGRKLDPPSLFAILRQYCAPRTMTYGESGSAEYFEAIFSSLPDLSADDVMTVEERIMHNSIGGDRAAAGEDTLLFKQMTGDLLYFLSSRREAPLREAISPFADKYILSRPDIWDGSDDSLKVVSMALMQKDITGRSPVGSKVPPLKVRGKLIRATGSHEGIFNLSRPRWGLCPSRETYIMIYSRGCGNCEEQLSLIPEFLSSRGKGASVLLLDLDDILSRDEETGKALLSAFDLTAVPYVTLIDKRGTVLERYCSFGKHSEGD